ncbi:MAG: hypothetical protein K9M45_09145 [Kiritimatiellales bacterium]|nr:hypothetical protein [Kiritimatiellales bacterium]
MAVKLGLSFSPDITKKIQPKLKFINRLQYGKNHQAQKVFRGRYQQENVVIFDFCYLSDLATPKDNIHDQFCFFTLSLPRSFPEVTIYKEGLVSKMVQLAGKNDIDFESHEFSRKFRVRSDDPKFAYDFCNALMIDYLLENTDLSIEIDRNILCVSFNKPLDLETVEFNLKRLLKIRSLMPDYLFDS